MHQPTPIQRDNKDVSLKQKLPGYQAKINLLKQIDDAASQLGSSQPKSVRGSRLNDVRQSEQKRTGEMVLGMKTFQRKDGLAHGSLRDSDLESLNKLQSNYIHTKTLLGQTKDNSLIYPQTDYKLDGPQYIGNEDMRSLKSEFDYSHKKKFTDVLGNITRQPGNGLKGLSQGVKNLQDNSSMRSAHSKYSQMSRQSAAKRFSSVENMETAGGQIESIPEEEYTNKLRLNGDQIEYLRSLDNFDIDEATGEIDFEQIQNMDPYCQQQLRLLGDPDEFAAGLHAVPIHTNKRLYPAHYHQNSEDYKNLGNLHKENRTIEYYPQDQKPQFQTRPVIHSNNQRTYLDETEKFQDTMRKSLAGKTANQPSIRINDNLGHTYIKYDPMTDTGNTISSGFPLTTNQDFHNGEPFDKQRIQKGGCNKQNNKKATIYNSYVNAMFNSGVFANPVADQC